MSAKCQMQTWRVSWWVAVGRRVQMQQPYKLLSLTPSIEAKSAPCSGRHLCRSREADIVLDHCIRSNRHTTGVRQIKFAEHDLVAPDLAQKILEHLNRQLLARAPPVAKAEWRESGIIANRMGGSVDHAEHGAEAAIGDVGLAAVFHLEVGDVERTPRQADLPAFVVVDLGAGRDAKVPLRIEHIRVFPVDWVQAGRGVRRADIAVSF
jgi:hypothetical protein